MNTYNERMARFAEDLINTFDTFLDEPEHLRATRDLDTFLAQRGFSSINATEADLSAVKALREHLRQLWTADSLKSAQAGLNRLLREQRLQIEYGLDEDRLVTQVSAPPDAPLVDRVAATAAIGLGWAITHHGLDRMRACTAAPCKDVFIDISKNATRRFCSERCANRHNVAQFRARQKS